MNQNEFVKNLNELGIEINDNQLNQLNRYYELLIKYNKIMNLTTIIKKEDVYLKHFYDSLTISKIIDLNKENSLCDIGSGAGFPGIVLKIMYPNLDITLVDSLLKRVNFLNIVISELNLKKIVAIHSRIEDYAILNREKFDVATARAVAPLNILIELIMPIVREKKFFISMKGNIQKEPDYFFALSKLSSIETDKIQFRLPIEDSQRTLIKIQKIDKNSNIFPRKYNEIKKKPL